MTQFADDPLWRDIQPLEQDEGPKPIMTINYSPEYKEAMDYFRGVMHQNDLSRRVLDLTATIIDHNPGHYMVWQYRCRVLDALDASDEKADWAAEVGFLNTLLQEHPKGYQGWHHREYVINQCKRVDGEKAFLHEILMEDAKNYHCWAYRQWLVKTFHLFAGEDAFVDDMLALDVRNNSAWNHRHFIVSHTKESKSAAVQWEEMQFAMNKLERISDNESGWNYLRGLLLLCMKLHKKKHAETISRWWKQSPQQHADALLSWLHGLNQEMNRFAQALLAEVFLAKGQPDQAKQVMDLLS